MARSISVHQKKRGRGRPATGRDPVISLRLPAALIEAASRWGSKQSDPTETRSEAIRRLIELGLSSSRAPRPGAHKGAAKAKAIAEAKIEPLIDPTVPEEERARRKRRLLKGPEEFRELRTDLPKRKV